jgi:hypothetical protein
MRDVMVLPGCSELCPDVLKLIHCLATVLNTSTTAITSESSTTAK